MRPEKLAEAVAATITAVVEPLKRALQDQQQELQDLKSALAALEATAAELRKENALLRASLGGLEQHAADPSPRIDFSRGTKH